MALRPARCYRWDSPAYTRVAKKLSNAYIVGVPKPKITRFDLGNLKERFEVELSAVIDEDVQIRHNALEAARMAANRYLERELGKTAYRLRVRVYPHHVMRENVMAKGAGADRIQKGMRQAFGKPIGMAARVRRGQAILSVYLRNEAKKIEAGKIALKRALAKLPGHKKRVEVRVLT